MSTKIYNGFIIKEDLSLIQLKVLIMRLRKKAQRIIRKELLDLTTIESINLIDRIAMGKEVCSEWKRPLISYVKDKIEKRYINIVKTQRRDPEYDFYFDIVILPIKNKILLMAFAERNSLLNLIRNQTWIEEYCYWNNSNEPENVTDEEWKQREVDWDEALGDNAIPDQNGFKVTLSLPFLYDRTMTVADILKNMPTYKYRIDKLVKYKAINEITKIIKVEEKETDIHSTLRAFDLIDDPKYQDIKDSIRCNLEKVLPKEITADHLLQELPKKETTPEFDK